MRVQREDFKPSLTQQCDTFLPSGRPLFQGFFLGGFECSDHQLENGDRLDLLASTRHDELASADYVRLQTLGMTGCREGISWVKSEPHPGQFDFSSATSRLRAADGKVQISWDLMHFGWPDHVDVFASDFPARFGRYAKAVATWFAQESDSIPMFTPINEMSFLSWAGGDVCCMNPFQLARGTELKVQFVLASIEAIEAIRSVLPHARFVHSEPVINIIPSAEHPKTWRRVECDNLLQYEALDMLSGTSWSKLGGHRKYLDIVGVNFYSDNQFMLDGTTVTRDSPEYKPFSQLLMEVWERYARPMLITETGSEGEGRAEWLRYVSDECAIAMQQGCELHGITIYPVINHPGWVDGRYCPNGLWDYADEDGERALHAPLAEEILRQAPLLVAAREQVLSLPTLHARPDVAAAEL